MLIDQLKADLTTARKNRDSEKTTWLSTLIGELQRGGKDFDDAHVLGLIKKNVDTLKENLKVSPGHVATQSEMDFLLGYLPQQMSEDEVRAAVRELIAGGANSIKLLMPELQNRYKGRYDGRLASGIVKEELAAAGA